MNTIERHLTDAELMRVLDGEAAPPGDAHTTGTPADSADRAGPGSAEDFADPGSATDPTPPASPADSAYSAARAGAGSAEDFGPADPANPGNAADFDPAAHVATCARCTDALAALRTESDLVTDWLERAAFEEPFEAAGQATGGVPDTAAVEASDTGPVEAPVEGRVVGAPDTGSVEGPVGARVGATHGAGPSPRARPEVRFEAPVRPPDNAGRTRHGGPASRRRLPGAGALLKAAAVILLLTAPLAAFPGVRAWVADRVAPTTTAESTSADPDAVVVRFTPTPGGFQVRFPAGTSGLLALDRSDGEDAELRALGGTPETVVTASSLEIRNPAASRYELRLPVTVTGVWVRVGDRAVSVSDTQIERGAVVELGG